MKLQKKARKGNTPCFH